MTCQIVKCFVFSGLSALHEICVTSLHCYYIAVLFESSLTVRETEWTEGNIRVSPFQSIIIELENELTVILHVCVSENFTLYCSLVYLCYILEKRREFVNGFVRFEVFTAVTMKNGIFWDVTPCGPCKNRHFGGT
jgi:hypothetical protein